MLIPLFLCLFYSILQFFTENYGKVLTNTGNYSNIVFVRKRREEKMRLKREIKKVSDLVNKKNYVPVLSNNKIILVVNMENGRSYRPKNNLMILQ